MPNDTEIWLNSKMSCAAQILGQKTPAKTIQRIPSFMLKDLILSSSALDGLRTWNNYSRQNSSLKTVCFQSQAFKLVWYKNMVPYTVTGLAFAFACVAC